MHCLILPKMDYLMIPAFVKGYNKPQTNSWELLPIHFDPEKLSCSVP